MVKGVAFVHLQECEMGGEDQTTGGDARRGLAESSVLNFRLISLI
jgi:hypothetical protein